MLPNTVASLCLAGRATTAVLAMLIAGCGGGSSNNGELQSTTNLSAYAALPVPTVVPMELTESQRAEVAAAARSWAVETLITRDGGFPENGVVLPPLYFARVQAVAAAASGTTLALLRRAIPVPTDNAIVAALTSGLRRSISASAEASVMRTFMDTVTAREHPDTWESLSLEPLSASRLAASPNLRMQIVDELVLNIGWPAVSEFDGVFVNDAGARVRSRMLRISGPTLTRSDGIAKSVALSLPQERWLISITPQQALESLSAASLNLILASTITWLGTATAVPSSLQPLVLPLQATFRPLGIYDIRGMEEAQSVTQADLRGIDGKGGTFAELSSSGSILNITAAGLQVFGFSAVSFIFSPDNRFGGGVVTTQLVVLPPVACAGFDLRSSYLVLIDKLGRIEMAARFSRVGGAPCS